MDNAPYHHKREFKSFSALKNKSEIIEEMLKAGVKRVTLPANKVLAHQVPTPDSAVPINEDSEWKEYTNEKQQKKYYHNSSTGVTSLHAPAEGVFEKEQPPPIKGREQDVRIELGKEIPSAQPNANSAGDIEHAAERSTSKYFYSQTGRKGTTIPTTDELKEACIVEIKRIKAEDGTDLLKCAVQEMLENGGHQLIWTPAYTPWLQPIEVRTRFLQTSFHTNWWC
jgi:hypothetical protein